MTRIPFYSYIIGWPSLICGTERISESTKYTTNKQESQAFSFNYAENNYANIAYNIGKVRYPMGTELRYMTKCPWIIPPMYVNLIYNKKNS